MAFEMKQSLKLGQQLLMTPQLQQAIKLLQLSRMELEQFVASQLAENPVLEEGVTESAEEKIQVEREKETTEAQAINDHMKEAGKIVDAVPGTEKQEVDWEATSRHKESAPIASSAARKDDEHPNYENMVTKANTLQDHLMIQCGELDFNDEEKKIAISIAGNIDDKGYLTLTLEELIEQNGFDLELTEGVLDTIQRLDPSGAGARDLKECLLIQLRNDQLRNGVVERIVEEHLPELETRNFNAIAKSLKISIDEVIENVQTIAMLEPVPGRQFGNDQTQYVVPDVYVFKLGEEWVVSLNEEGLPRLKISDFYQEMAKENDEKAKEAKKNKEKKDTKTDNKKAEEEYVSEKLKSASWLIKSIQQRQRTIFRVTESIVERQKNFFDMGVEKLKPMILRDIAEDIEMHESTISRVTNNKYVHTPRGIFELKYFFNSSVTRTDGLDVASESVKQMIAEIIKKEDVKRPFSDQKIVDLLDTKGIQLARRTVAKYREQLGILPSSKRKKFF